MNTSAPAEQTRKYLEGHNLDKLFDKIYGRETSKDKVEKFKKIISDHGVTADETIQITDTLGDMKEAEKIGIKSIIVTYGYQDKSFFDGNEDSVLGFADNPKQILSYINSSG